MKRFFRFIFALLALFCVACTNSGEEGGLPGGDNGGNGGNTPPPAVTFAIEVSDKTPINAKVSVTPSDKTITYFCDAVSKVEFERFATAKYCARKVISDLKTACESQGYTLVDVLLTGADSRRFIGFVPETEYYVLAFGVDADGTITTEVAIQPFTTLAEVVDAEMTFKVKVSNITTNGAYVVVTPSNSAATYYYDVVSKEELDGYADAKTYAKKVIASIKEHNDLYGISLAWNLSAGVDKYLFKEGTIALAPNTDYCAFAFGVTTEGTITTEVILVPFKTLAVSEAGDKNIDNLVWGRVTGYGDEYNVGAKNWVIVLYDETRTSEFDIELQTELSATELPLGEYPINSTMSAGTAIAGADDEGYYGTFWKNSVETVFCKSGTVVLGKEGDNYTISVNALDDHGNTITASYAGELEKIVYDF